MPSTEFTQDDIIAILDDLALSTVAYPRPPDDPPVREVVLYLQPQVMYLDGHGYLPVRVVNGEQGYFPFRDTHLAAVARYFGTGLGWAERRVSDINAARGFLPERVREICIQSFWQ